LEAFSLSTRLGGGVCFPSPDYLSNYGFNSIVLGFLINLPCGGAVVLLLLFVSIPDYKVKGDGKETVLHKLSKLDLIGFCIFTPTVIQFILALQWGGIKFSWNSATIIGLFCGAFGNLLLFLAWEYHMGDAAMIPFSLMRRRIVWCSCINLACFIGCVFTTAYYFPIYFQAVRNATPTISGVDMLPQIITNMLVTIATGALGITRIPFPIGNC
jgi:hypothetical protein